MNLFDKALAELDKAGWVKNPQMPALQGMPICLGVALGRAFAWGIEPGDSALMERFRGLVRETYPERMPVDQDSVLVAFNDHELTTEAEVRALLQRASGELVGSGDDH